MTCSYASKYNQCVSANENGWARSIENFVCIEQKWWWEEVLLQIILDEKFREIDQQAEEYLEKLEKSKDAYFGAEPQNTFLAALDDITANFSDRGIYWQEYHNVYEQEVIPDYFECTDSITNVAATDFLKNYQNWIVTNLIDTKLFVYRKVAYNVLKLNRLEIRKDDRKDYIIQERKKYNVIMQLMLNILWYIERIVNGWPTKSKNVW